jgi:hypothetical protein
VLAKLGRMKKLKAQVGRSFFDYGSKGGLYRDFEKDFFLKLELNLGKTPITTPKFQPHPPFGNVYIN